MKTTKKKTVMTDDELAKVRDALLGKHEALKIFERLLEHAGALQKQLDSFGEPLMIYKG